MQPLTATVVQDIIRRVLNNQDYRIKVLDLINAEFLQFVVDFFKLVVEAKLSKKPITSDWYREHFMSTDLTTNEIIRNSGLNRKTISNMYGTAKRSIVLEAASINYESLLSLIDDLISQGDGIDIQLKIELHEVSVSLNISETLIVINTLAVKRAELHGGLWSTAGKRVERPLWKPFADCFKSQQNTIVI